MKKQQEEIEAIKAALKEQQQVLESLNYAQPEQKDGHVDINEEVLTPYQINKKLCVTMSHGSCNVAQTLCGRFMVYVLINYMRANFALKTSFS